MMSVRRDWWGIPSGLKFSSRSNPEGFVGCKLLTLESPSPWWGSKSLESVLRSRVYVSNHVCDPYNLDRKIGQNSVIFRSVRGSWRL